MAFPYSSSDKYMIFIIVLLFSIIMTIFATSIIICAYQVKIHQLTTEVLEYQKNIVDNIKHVQKT